MPIEIQAIPTTLIAIAVWLLSFIITYITIPRIIYLAKAKNLVDKPNGRSSHKESTPTLGGVAFFLSLVVTLFVISFFYDHSQSGMSIVVGLTILFFIGVKDDIIALSPRTKLISQLIAALTLLSNQEFWVQSFDGCLGIDTIPMYLSILMGCFIIFSIVNSFNLIDGINGSASMVGISIFGAFAYLFFSVGLTYYALVSLVGTAFLLAFLRYNLSKTQKIFMGDTGSLIVGFLIGALILRFLSLDAAQLEQIGILPSNKFPVALAIPFIPFVDTLRVFTIRILKNRKPFTADRNHVHHIMIDYTHLSHSQASLLLGFFNLLAFAFIFFLSTKLAFFKVVGILLLMICVFAGILFSFNKNYASCKKKQKIRKALQKAKDNTFFFF